MNYHTSISWSQFSDPPFCNSLKQENLSAKINTISIVRGFFLKWNHDYHRKGSSTSLGLYKVDFKIFLFDKS